MLRLTRLFLLIGSFGVAPVLCQTALPCAEADASNAPMGMPGMTGPLAANAHPTCIDAGPLGKVFVTGAVSGLGLVQDNEIPGDRGSRVDVGNAQVFIQKIDGPLQFFVQVGRYALPALGTAYVRASDITDLTYGYVPQAFLRFVPNEHFNVMLGKLPTLIGAEYTFTFENMNINRGLLWNQENAVNRGVQVNYADGPVTVALSVNDGFYSDKYNWLSGHVAYAVTPHDTLAFVAMGNLGETSRSSFATPLLQNNSQIYNIIYTHNAGPLTVTPYLQYTRVPANGSIGIIEGASTFGAAVLAKYSFTPEFSLAGRVEYIGSNGSAAQGSPSLLYGPGSSAWSITFSPTYQRGIFFARADLSYVRANNTTAGFAFGADFAQTSQARAMLEAGVLF